MMPVGIDKPLFPGVRLIEMLEPDREFLDRKYQRPPTRRGSEEGFGPIGGPTCRGRGGGGTSLVSESRIRPLISRNSGSPLTVRRECTAKHPATGRLADH